MCAGHVPLQAIMNDRHPVAALGHLEAMCMYYAVAYGIAGVQCLPLGLSDL